VDSGCTWFVPIRECRHEQIGVRVYGATDVDDRREEDLRQAEELKGTAQPGNPGNHDQDSTAMTIAKLNTSPTAEIADGSAPISAEDADSGRQLLQNLLKNSRLYCSSTNYKELLDFVTKLRNFAPFNALLLQGSRISTSWRFSQPPARLKRCSL